MNAATMKKHLAATILSRTTIGFAAILAVGTAFGQPAITQPPQDLTNTLGTTATFTVWATGTQPLAYQWQKYLTDWSDLADCSSAALVLTNVQTSDDADYRVAVTNVQGAVTSAAAHLYVILPPAISTSGQPAKFASVSLGATVGNRVVASGTAPLAYQWRLYGVPVPGQTKSTLTLTNVQLADAGDYTAVVTNLAGSITSRVATLDVDATWTKITSDPLVTSLIYEYVAAAWVDLDNDGFLDLVLAKDDSRGPNPIYHNNGDGTFTRVIEPSLQTIQAEAFAFRWGDYDNDGFLDVFVPEGFLWAYSSPPYTKNLLYHNNGNGTFTQVTNSPIVKEGGISTDATWGDYDRDGYPDLFVANGTAGPAPAKNWFYQNQGDGTFLKLSNDVVRPMISELGNHMEPIWVDIDNDGWQDLFIANEPASRNCLYRNNAGRAFVKVTDDPLVTESADWGDAEWADYDNDGNLDVFLTTSSWNTDLGPVALFHNDGQGHFTKMTTNDIGSLASERANALFCCWGDYDNDGWLDLYIPPQFYNVATPTAILYHNNGDGTFTKVTRGSPVNDPGGSYEGWLVDLNNDGFLDLVAFKHRDPDNALVRYYRNNGNSNAWLCVKCVGTVSPRFATGTKVRVKATIRGKPMWQLRVIDTLGAVGMGQTATAHFGLGDATNVEVLRIEWTSGIVQEFTNVAVKQHLTVTEPARLSMPSLGELHIQCWKGMAYGIQVSPDLSAWTPLATVTNLTGKLQWTDPDAPGQSARFYRAVKQ